MPIEQLLFEFGSFFHFSEWCPLLILLLCLCIACLWCLNVSVMKEETGPLTVMLNEWMNKWMMSEWMGKVKHIACLVLFFDEIFSLTQRSEICEMEATAPHLSGEKEWCKLPPMSSLLFLAHCFLIYLIYFSQKSCVIVGSTGDVILIF